jgi:hypothetical protein
MNNLIRFLLLWVLLLFLSKVTSGEKSKKSYSKTTTTKINSKQTSKAINMLDEFRTTIGKDQSAFNFKQSNTTSNSQINYCSFFNNRAPSPQINLKNCTWYRNDSCCLQSEIESTFSKVNLFYSNKYILYFII